MYVVEFIFLKGISQVFGCAFTHTDRIDDGSDNMLSADAIAHSYMQFHKQHRSAWAWEIELRPWVERF